MKPKKQPTRPKMLCPYRRCTRKECYHYQVHDYNGNCDIPCDKHRKTCNPEKK